MNEVAPSDPVSSEIAEIQARMVADREGYFRDGTMQERYRELVAHRDGDESETEPTSLPSLLSEDESYEILADMGPECSALADAWGDAGGYGSHLRNVQTSVLQIIEGLSVREQSVFMERFDTLPESVIASIYLELSLGRMNFLPEVTNADVERFASTPEGAELVDEWGHTAPARIALVQARFSRLVESMKSQADKAIFLAWFNSLSARVAKSILLHASR